MSLLSLVVIATTTIASLSVARRGAMHITQVWESQNMNPPKLGGVLLASL